MVNRAGPLHGGEVALRGSLGHMLCSCLEEEAKGDSPECRTKHLSFSHLGPLKANNNHNFPEALKIVCFLTLEIR